MVSLLIVSHSPHIATGIKELATQMTGGRVPIAAVGGTSDGRIGTNPDGIRAGYEAVASPDGVLVLMDLGSALLSAEVALEHVPFPLHLSKAPLVEGAVLAAVEASVGSDLQQTAAAAERACGLDKLGDWTHEPAVQAAPGSSVEATVVIDHPAGLHLRPAARFVTTAARFASNVYVQNLSRSGAPKVDAKSMLGLMQSGVTQGHEIRLYAEGEDAEAAIAALVSLIAHNFEDT
jgi:phosphoenolpyruvate---glycerone phosphotransferase subunit DhaM